MPPTKPIKKIEELRIEYATITSLIITILIFTHYPSIDWTTKIIRAVLAILTYPSILVITYYLSHYIITKKSEKQREKWLQKRGLNQ